MPLSSFLFPKKRDTSCPRPPPMQHLRPPPPLPPITKPITVEPPLPGLKTLVDTLVGFTDHHRGLTICVHRSNTVTTPPPMSTSSPVGSDLGDGAEHVKDDSDGYLHDEDNREVAAAAAEEEEEGEFVGDDDDDGGCCWASYGRRRGRRPFPPPITLLTKAAAGRSRCLMPWVLERSYEDGGRRLVIHEVKVRHHEYLRACRSGGRLTLTLVHVDDNGEEDPSLAMAAAENSEEARHQPQTSLPSPSPSPTEEEGGERLTDTAPAMDRCATAWKEASVDVKHRPATMPVLLPSTVPESAFEVALPGCYANVRSTNSLFEAPVARIRPVHS